MLKFWLIFLAESFLYLLTYLYSRPFFRINNLTVGKILDLLIKHLISQRLLVAAKIYHKKLEIPQTPGMMKYASIILALMNSQKNI